MTQETLLITGAAGFIGSHLARVCLARGHKVVGLDNLNDYYDPTLKQARLDPLLKIPGFAFEKASLEDNAAVRGIFEKHRPDRVVNLAAQAGVRYSLENPRAYIDANIVGFLNILEACRAHQVAHLAYASSSSVYGANTKLPFSVHDNVDHPLSLYAASKKANELMAHTYSHLFRIPTTGLRFFTVYGPWGRPDMALFLFTKNILAGKPIDVFNGGHHKRDFTYIDDIVEGVYRVTFNIPQADPAWDARKADPATSSAPYRVYNIGNSSPVELMHYIRTLEDKLGKKAILNMLPMQPGDVPSTEADVADLVRDVGFKPETTVETGIGRFVDWYRGFYGA
ncbi:MAG: NAD-dependent epimerase/dehydratase [Fibrobacteres bacterium]|nr:NAD-dependent epimerase/dehydratase [Fibrobacterota bacterium]